ncbi:double-strand break repair protein AddB [Novosphingobium lentum]|uniref:double-strand break repair protein AddB n=1 Tax=Novosphingobium lentum TaxID=145287 RepID=UPI00082EFF9D|nr:double-strand break repair protein AddB [Novosphingobium lentum]
MSDDGPAATPARGRSTRVYSIAAHRGFADALVAGLIPRYRQPGFGLARLTLLLPSQRAVRTVTEAFVRASSGERHGGLMLPRMAVVGDLDLDETLGSLLDPLGAGTAVPPAADPVYRLQCVAQLLREELGRDAPGEAGLLRQARSIVRSMDRMAVEDVAPDTLLSDTVLGLVGELSDHWKDSIRQFASVQARWRAELDARGEVDAPERRNRLLDHAAQRWCDAPPPHPVVAAGVTSASPAVARLLRSIADLADGGVILPDLDLALDDAVWCALGVAGAPYIRTDPPFGRDDAVTHPQYHLKLLLNRMGIARGEVMPWHRAGLSPAPPERSRAISNLFLPPEASTAWVGLPAAERRLGGVRIMATAHPEEEAQAIAILIREALATPERRVALVSPDRGLASRVIAHLARWNIAADDTAGRPLPQTAAGRLVLAIADVMAQRAAPVPLLALLGHPLVRAGVDRPAWLECVRLLDRALRGPRPGPGLDAVRTAILRNERDHPGLAAWWSDVAAVLDPLFGGDERMPLADAIDLLATMAETLGGEAVWGQADGRSLAAFIESWREAALASGLSVDIAELPALLRDALDDVAVRPPYGGHPRLAIYGLLEARMSRADLVICGGMTEGSWPAAPAPDPLLAPPIQRALGIPGADFRIGLSAHDLAAALGAPDVVLSHAARDAGAPAIPSRFLLRMEAMLGTDVRRETEAVRLARAIDAAAMAAAYPRPAPMPDAAQRQVAIAVTALDRLRGDPYQFYAQAILGLRSLDPLDADPTPAWKGTAVHEILEAWHEQGAMPGALIPLAEVALDEMSAHPFMRGLWRPRLLAGLAWVERHTDDLLGTGREVIAYEQRGEIRVKGIRIHGRADRIDRDAEGNLAVLDYKTGAPPTGAMVEKGFALQLGLIGLIAQGGGFEHVSGTPTRFEYWSLARGKDGEFGYAQEPVLEGQKRHGLPRDEFLDITQGYLIDAIDRWILGSDPFTARLNPDLAGYADYDQLMRLDEWQGRSRGNGAAAGDVP